jgi:hypothetical protein
VVEERLGHQTAKMTLDLYGHFVPGLQEKFIRGLDSRFLPETASKAGTPGATRTPDTRFRKPVDALFGDFLTGIINLGEIASQIKLALGSNGHKAEKLQEIKELLQHEVSK